MKVRASLSLLVVAPLFVSPVPGQGQSVTAGRLLPGNRPAQPGFILTESAVSAQTVTTLATKMDRMSYQMMVAGWSGRVIVKARTGYGGWL